MDWNAPDLVTQWKSFKQHCQFWFAGPLIKASEAQKCNYVMIWIRDKGRDIYSTWDLSEEDGKKLDVLYTNCEKHVKPKIKQNLFPIQVSKQGSKRFRHFWGIFESCKMWRFLLLNSTKCNKKHHFPLVCLSSTTYKEFKPMKPKPHKLHTLRVDDNTYSESEWELFIDTIEEVNSLSMDEWKRDNPCEQCTCKITVGHGC